MKLVILVEGDLKVPFSIATPPRCRGRSYSIPRIAHFTLDPHLIVLSAKQGGIKYHFLSLWYESTWNWTSVSQTIGEHSTHLANGLVYWKQNMRKETLFMEDIYYICGRLQNVQVKTNKQQVQLFNWLFESFCHN